MNNTQDKIKELKERVVELYEESDALANQAGGIEEAIKLLGGDVELKPNPLLVYEDSCFPSTTSGCAKDRYSPTNYTVTSTPSNECSTAARTPFAENVYLRDQLHVVSKDRDEHLAAYVQASKDRDEHFAAYVRESAENRELQNRLNAAAETYKSAIRANHEAFEKIERLQQVLNSTAKDQKEVLKSDDVLIQSLRDDLSAARVENARRGKELRALSDKTDEGYSLYATERKAHEETKARLEKELAAAQAENKELAQECADCEADRSFVCGALEETKAKLRTYETGGLGLLARERNEQVHRHGYGPNNDDAHSQGQLRRAALCYARPDSAHQWVTPTGWPWADRFWIPSSDPIKCLTKAGALIVAEIERLQRLRASKSSESPF